MIIKTKDSVPQIYSDSYDMLLFFALLDGLQASSFLDISRVRGQHSPINCFEEDLKGLATCFDIPTLNRELLLKEFGHILLWHCLPLPSAHIWELIGFSGNALCPFWLSPHMRRPCMMQLS